MNFRELYQAKAQYDELMVIEKNIEKQERLYHIVGMTRCGTQAVLYVLEQENYVKKSEQTNALERKNKKQENCLSTKQTNRMQYEKCFRKQLFF